MIFVIVIIIASFISIVVNYMIRRFIIKMDFIMKIIGVGVI